jgi:hypothetical protein
MTAVHTRAVARPAWLTLADSHEHTESVAHSVARGRELARLGVEEVVSEIRRRAASRRLNRGLSLSLPYFDDAALELRHRELTVVPRGRVQFVPAFVVLASEHAAESVRHDSTLSESTRQHLIEALERLAAAFRN